MTDETLMKLVNELRERPEYRQLVEAVQELRGIRESYAIARQEIPEDPKDAGTLARFVETADRLDDAALQVEDWFDEYAPAELQDPYRSEAGYVPLRNGPRS